MPKTDDGSVPMTLVFPGDIYYYLKRIAELDRRSMNQEVFFLIEQAAKRMKVKLDMDNDNVKKHIMADVMDTSDVFEAVPAFGNKELPNKENKDKIAG